MKSNGLQAAAKNKHEMAMDQLKFIVMWAEWCQSEQ